MGACSPSTATRTGSTKYGWRRAARRGEVYRPARWSDAAILEEHDFTRELAEREIPVVTATEIGGRVLHEFQGFRFAVFPRRADGRQSSRT